MTHISDNRRGDITELELCHHFLNQGFEVFKNVACTGPIDFIVLNNDTNEFTLYDSKTPTIHTREDGSRRVGTTSTTARQKELNVHVVALYNGKVYTDTDRIGVVIDEDSPATS